MSLTDPLTQIADFFNTYNGILAFVSIVIAIFTFFYQQHLEKKKEKKELHDLIRRFCDMILNDISSIRVAITSKEYSKIKREDKNIEYTAILISTSLFRSLLHSGVFTHFEIDTQINLDKLYYKIKGHNDNIGRRIDIMIAKSEFPESNFQKLIDIFEGLITDREKEIKRLLDQSEESINKELKKIDKKFIQPASPSSPS